MKQILFFTIVLTLSFSALAENISIQPPEDADPETQAALSHGQQVDELFLLHKAKQKDDPDWFVRRGVRAHRTKRFVQIDAEATGLPAGHPLEFVLIGIASGHDYEALAIAYALPSDVHDAIKWIGLPEGKAFNPTQRRFFPKGERVFATLDWDTPDGQTHHWPAESLIMDNRTADALVHEGFAFVGSQWLERDGEKQYAADIRGPHSIISIYNEPSTVLDRPRVATQGDVYGALHPYPDRQPEEGQFLHITLRPENDIGEYRIANVHLSIKPGKTESISLILRNDQEEKLHDGESLTNVLAALNRLTADEKTPHVYLRFDPDTPLKEIRRLIELLVSFQREDVLYIEPNSSEDLLYRAFLPVERHRYREHRPSQALELTLQPEEEGWKGLLADIEETRVRLQDPFTANVTEYPLLAPTDFEELIDTIQHPIPALLVFVPGEATYGELMAWVRPAMDKHPLVYLFLD